MHHLVRFSFNSSRAINSSTLWLIFLLLTSHFTTEEQLSSFLSIQHTADGESCLGKRKKERILLTIFTSLLTDRRRQRKGDWLPFSRHLWDALFSWCFCSLFCLLNTWYPDPSEKRGSKQAKEQVQFSQVRNCVCALFSLLSLTHTLKRGETCNFVLFCMNAFFLLLGLQHRLKLLLFLLPLRWFEGVLSWIVRSPIGLQKKKKEKFSLKEAFREVNQMRIWGKELAENFLSKCYVFLR